MCVCTNALCEWIHDLCISEFSSVLALWWGCSYLLKPRCWSSELPCCADIPKTASEESCHLAMCDQYMVSSATSVMSWCISWWQQMCRPTLNPAWPRLNVVFQQLYIVETQMEILEVFVGWSYVEVNFFPINYQFFMYCWLQQGMTQVIFYYTHMPP